MSDARGMALDDLARHILPTMLGSMSKREREEAKKALPKKTKKKAMDRPMPKFEDEMEDDEDDDEKSCPATISIFEMIGSSASEDKFNEDKKKAESPKPQRRIAKKRPVRRK